MNYFLFSTRLLLVFALVILSTRSVSSQIAIGYHPFQSVLSVSSTTEKSFWLDYKLETNSFLSNINMEFSPKYNVRMSERVNYYLGAGISINPLNGASDLPVTNGYFFDCGARIKPLSEDRNVQIIFELSPYVNREFSGGSLRTRLGIGYNFN